MGTDQLLPPQVYLKRYVITSTTRFRVDDACHVCLTANQDGKFYVTIMDRKDGAWSVRGDGTAQPFGNRFAAEAYATAMHKKENRVVQLRESVKGQNGTAP